MKKKLHNLGNVAGLKFKLTITFAAIFAVAFIGITVISYTVSRYILLRNINAQTEELVYNSAADIDQWISDRILTVNTFVKLIKSLPEDKYITRELISIYESDIFSSMYYVAASGPNAGKLIGLIDWTPPDGYNPFTRPWYTIAVNEKKTSISQIYVDAFTNELNFTISAPIYNKDKTLRGVFAADILLKTLEEKLDKIKSGKMGFAILINNSGIVLAHNDKSLIGTNLLDNPKFSSFIREIIDKKEGKLHYNIESDKYIIFTNINSGRWIFGVVLIKKEIYSELSILAIKSLIIFIISLFVVIFTSNYFSKKLTLFIETLEMVIESQTADLKEQISRVEYLSLTDPLTEIANRRKVELTLKAEIDRTRRTNKPLSIIMVDIDHFKSFNDTYGHETGDKVLRQFAKTINNSIRITDLVGRIGGEEFLVICPETNLSQANILAEKLRLEVEAIQLECIDFIDSVDKITASFGCAELLPGENSFDPILSRSDKALYRAKEHGRNRVEVY